jgi:hypothetical protein
MWEIAPGLTTAVLPLPALQPWHAQWQQIVLPNQFDVA